MPLSFKSLSHGDIAFGFFNIESDLLLLENYFFFADDFCRLIASAAKEDGSDREMQTAPAPEKTTLYHLTGYVITSPSDVGDLMGAIHGIHFSGFIGEVYKRFPFPSDPAGFKQNPEGTQTRQIITDIIQQFAVTDKITITFLNNRELSIGKYRFDLSGFHELLHYVDRGGYPRWKDELKPGYVLDMNNTIRKSNHLFFKGAFPG